MDEAWERFESGIRVSNLRVECVVGVYPEERNTLQPVDIDLRLELDWHAAAASEQLGASVDYALVARTVAATLRLGHFLLLESAALASARAVSALLALRAPQPLKRLALQLSKPHALRSQALPSVSLDVAGSRLPRASDTRSFEVFRTPRVSLYLESLRGPPTLPPGPRRRFETLAIDAPDPASTERGFARSDAVSCPRQVDAEGRASALPENLSGASLYLWAYERGT